MFSSTTIASSMTMPTDSVSASMVIMFSVKPMYQISPKVAMIEVGIAMAAMIVERRFARNSSTTSAARIEPTIEVLLDVVDGRLDEGRTGRGPPARGSPAAGRRELARAARGRSSRLRRCWCPTGGGRWSSTVATPSMLASVVGSASPSSTRATSAMRDRVALGLADDDVVELGDRSDAAARAEGQRLSALVDAAAGHLDVLRLQRARDVGDGHVVGAHAGRRRARC